MPSANRGSRGRIEGNGIPAASSLSAFRLTDQKVFTQSGQTGTIANVLVGDDGQQYAVIDFGQELGRHQVPLAGLVYESNRFLLHETDARGLPNFTEGQAGLRVAEPNARINVAGYASGRDDASILVRDAAPQVTVERPALLINWEQAAPEVTVHQPVPHVHVRQARPQIIVRQPLPRITIELDEPEIIVRMPDPTVDVSMTEPDVKVFVPRPVVKVIQSEQPEVKISAGEPLVSLFPREEADIAIERDQAEVRYERVGEPQLIVRQMNGKAKVRFEEMAGGEALAPSARSAIATTVDVSELVGRKVFDLQGDEAGTIDRVVSEPDGKRNAVIAHGGFLGIASHRVLVPLSKLAMQDDRLVVPSLSAKEFAAMSGWDEGAGAYSLAEGQVHIPHWL